ncbi:hypothetical protein KUV44_12290, partial [Marinobacter daepoensis]
SVITAHCGLINTTADCRQMWQNRPIGKLKRRWPKTLDHYMITALLVATTGYLRSPVEPEWTLTGFNNFVALFKLPIGLASIAIPLAALVASHHRSIQTASQIISQQEQNTFSNYVKHREYFSKFIDEEGLLNGKSSFKAVNKKVYDILFPFAAQGDLNSSPLLNEDDVERIDELISYTVRAAQQVDWATTDNIEDLKDLIDELRSEIQVLFSLEVIDPYNGISIENILYEIMKIRTTLQHLSSASSFLDPYSGDEHFEEWSHELSKANSALKTVRNFELAEERLKDISNSGARNGVVILNEAQAKNIRDLLGENSSIKIKFLTKKYENNQRLLKAIRQL